MLSKLIFPLCVLLLADNLSTADDATRICNTACGPDNEILNFEVPTHELTHFGNAKHRLNPQGDKVGMLTCMYSHKL